MAALIDPGDEVLIEWPTYEPLLGVASFHGAVVRRVDRRVGQDFGLDPDAVARALTPRTRLVVLANLHNPSSHYTDAAALERIGVLAARAGARVLVDEVYLDAVFDQTVRSAFHLGPTFVVTSSLTKVYGLSGLRCGWILAEPSLARRIWRLNDLFGNVDAHPAERLSVVAFRRLPALLARAQARLDTNRAIIGRFLESRDDLDGGVPLYGTTACLRPRAGRVDALCRVLRERYDVTVVPGSFFELPHYIRVGICGDAETLAEGLSRLGQALDELAATNTGST
jgi:aspartate/methionine/tyrosine aminotransferase